MRRNGLEPIVLEGCTTQQFLRFLIDNHNPPSNLIVCSSRECFLQGFLDELHPVPGPTSSQQDDDGHAPDGQKPLAGQLEIENTTAALLNPTLEILGSSMGVIVSFCPDLAHLLALLSVLPHRDPLSRSSTASGPGGEEKPTRSVLVILNPIRLHKPTSAYSAQGFNRTFASAVETAHRLRQQLILIETPEASDYSLPDQDVLMQNHHLEPEEEAQAPVPQQSSSPWDQQLSMLNVTTKTFGVGERGWVGRTVSVRQVAGRWCRFVKLRDDGSVR